MKRFLYILALVVFILTVFSCGDESGFLNTDFKNYSKTDYSIIGGEVSEADDFPAVGVFLGIASMGYGQTKGNMICTGTLIAPDVVLTAGHCTEDPTMGQASSFEWYFSLTLDVSSFGVSGFNLPALTYKVKKFVAHPDWVMSNIDRQTGFAQADDIALAYLEEPFIDSFGDPIVQSAAILEEDDVDNIYQGAPTIIVGYGQRTSETPSNPYEQPDGGVKYQAETIINLIDTYEMQIGDQPPTPQKCHGDSGGPSFIVVDDNKIPKHRLVGVTSRGYDYQIDCGMGGIDTRVDPYLNWIKNEMMDACNRGDRVYCENNMLPLVPEYLNNNNNNIINNNVSNNNDNSQLNNINNIDNQENNLNNNDSTNNDSNNNNNNSQNNSQNGSNDDFNVNSDFSDNSLYENFQNNEETDTEILDATAQGCACSVLP